MFFRLPSLLVLGRVFLHEFLLTSFNQSAWVIWWKQFQIFISLASGGLAGRETTCKRCQLNIAFFLPILEGMTFCVHRTEPTTIGLWFFRIGMLNRKNDWYTGIHNDTLTPHCEEDPIYVFPEMKLIGLVPSFHILVSVNDLYISTIGPPVYCCSEIGRLIMGMYKSLTDIWM